jgi:hypothetical protein
MLHYPDVHLTCITLTSTDIFKPYLDYLDITFNFNLMNVLLLGNEHLHQLTAQGKYNLRINMEDFDNNEKYATYKQSPFIGCINNAVIKLSIYLNSHVRIVGQIM